MLRPYTRWLVRWMLPGLTGWQPAFVREPGARFRVFGVLRGVRGPTPGQGLEPKN